MPVKLGSATTEQDEQLPKPNDSLSKHQSVQTKAIKLENAEVLNLRISTTRQQNKAIFDDNSSPEM